MQVCYTLNCLHKVIAINGESVRLYTAFFDGTELSGFVPYNLGHEGKPQMLIRDYQRSRKSELPEGYEIFDHFPLSRLSGARVNWSDY